MTDTEDTICRFLVETVGRKSIRPGGDTLKDTERIQLERLVLAPYLQKATALIGLARRVGGNQFRHMVATLAVLIDYKYTEPVLLKASVIHDLPEDIPATNLAEIEAIDEDGPQVVRLVLEVTRGNEPKCDYLKRLRETGSSLAKTLKVADRISNLTDLNTDVFDLDSIARLLDETEEYVVPMALEVNADMAIELQDLIHRKRRLLQLSGELG